MIKLLKIVYVLIFLGILYGTAAASLDRNVVDAIKDLWKDAWFRATILDTYFAFLTISFWVIYKEKNLLTALLWTAGIMILGNFAIAAYLLTQLFRLKPGDPFSKLLLRESDGGGK